MTFTLEASGPLDVERISFAREEISALDAHITARGYTTKQYPVEIQILASWADGCTVRITGRPDSIPSGRGGR